MADGKPQGSAKGRPGRRRAGEFRAAQRPQAGIAGSRSSLRRAAGRPRQAVRDDAASSGRLGSSRQAARLGSESGCLGPGSRQAVGWGGPEPHRALRGLRQRVRLPAAGVSASPVAESCHLKIHILGVSAPRPGQGRPCLPQERYKSCAWRCWVVIALLKAQPPKARFCAFHCACGSLDIFQSTNVFHC